jgi:hypothetical protein
VAENISLQVARCCVNAPHGLSLNTLKKHFRSEIDLGKRLLSAAAIERLSRDMQDLANPDGIRAAMYLAERYGE